MTPQEWEKIQTAFQHAITLDAAALAEYLQQLEQDDPLVFDKVRRMLAEDADPNDVLMAPVESAAAAFVESGHDSWIGRSVGNYKIESKIASGGMSAVYLGRRDDKLFDQDVAIKIVAGAFQSDDLATRFRTERQILASLKHPNIAQLHDGGTTAEGTPYLVMEYIDGLAIDDYCDTNSLGIRERLDLFTKVCMAVNYAHRNLIVHRDIKPSNIIVTHDGTPKLLDFGIAKPLEKAALSQTIAVTHANVRAMTPEFASPEQVRGETITTSTDVYSLGVLLYKLLSGRMPYLAQGSNIAAVAKAICDTKPSRPSTVITLADEKQDSSPEIVAQRGTSVGKLRKSLAGDLDNIVMMALQKDPERRYMTVNALMEDIRCYGANEPIIARPDSLSYRFGKFVSRHKTGVATTLLFAVLSIGMAAYHTWQVTLERDKAEAQAAKAEQVVDFMSDVFRSSSPYYAAGDIPTVEEILARGVEELDASLADQPEILSDLLLRLGTIHQDLGLYDEAARLLQRSLEMQQELYGQGDPRVVMAMLGVSALTFETGNLQDALTETEAALQIAESAEDPDPALVADAQRLLANIYFDQGNYDACIEYNQSALESFRSLGDAKLDKYALTLNNLASAYSQKGELQLALNTATEAYELKRSLHGEVHPTIGTSLTLLARINRQMANMAEAERLLRQGLDVREKLYGPDHPEFAIGLNALSGLLSSKQSWEEIEPMLVQSLAIFQNKFGHNHRWTNQSRGMLAEVYSETGRTDDSLRLARESLELAAGRDGGRTWEAAVAYAEYADTLLEARRDNEAISAYRNSVELFKEMNGGLATAYTQAKLGRALLEIGATKEAADLIAIALQFCRDEAPSRHTIVARVLVAKSELDVVRGQFGDAQAAAEEALQIIEFNDQIGTNWYWIARTVLGQVMLHEGREQDGTAELLAVVEGLKRENGTQSRVEATARALLEANPPG